METKIIFTNEKLANLIADNYCYISIFQICKTIWRDEVQGGNILRRPMVKRIGVVCFSYVSRTLRLTLFRRIINEWNTKLISLSTEWGVETSEKLRATEVGTESHLVSTSEREEQLRSQSLEPKRRPRTDKDGQSTRSGVGATTTATTYYPLRPLQEGRYSKSNLSNQTYQTKLTTLNLLNQTFLGWVHYCYFLPTTGDYKSSTLLS